MLIIHNRLPVTRDGMAGSDNRALIINYGMPVMRDEVPVSCDGMPGRDNGMYVSSYGIPELCAERLPLRILPALHFLKILFHSLVSFLGESKKFSIA